MSLSGDYDGDGGVPLLSGLAESRTWEEVFPRQQPPPREMHACCCARLVEGDSPTTMMLLHGGRCGDTVLADLWVLDLRNRQWKKRIDTKLPRCSHSMVPLRPPAKVASSSAAITPALAVQKVLLFGGFSGSDLINTLHEVDLQGK